MSPFVIGYIVYLVFIVIVGLAALFHCFKYSARGDKTQFAAGLYILTMVFLLIGGFVLIGSTDFS